MAAKDSYFTWKIQPNGTFLVVYPPMEGGAPLPADSVVDYVGKVITAQFDRLALRTELLKQANSVRDILVVAEKVPPISETVIVTIAPDRKVAKGRFYPPSEGGAMLTQDDIVAAMVKNGVKYGVIEENIRQFLREHRYIYNYTLAQATMQEEGSNAEITYYFNTDPTQKPKVNDDGSVDFHHLNMISPIKEGEMIAELKPATFGKPGIDVCGGVIRPTKVKQMVLRHGKNIRISEDGLRMFSEVNGHATLVGDQVFVSNEYEVPANVDLSTGDIDYDGNVLVRGNVIAGFTVKAQGDIIVEGVVEGATLIAGGQIILKRGIQGMNRGYLKAGSNVISRFIESATVEAGGYVTADAIMHSKVTAKEDITVESKKGFITGGVIRSTTMISARTIGSSMGTSTELEVGMEPEIMQEFRDLNDEYAKNQEEIEKMMQQLTALVKRLKLEGKLPPDKLLQMKTIKESREELDKRDEDIEKRLEVLREMIDSYDSGAVRVSSTIFPGCKVTISNAIYYVKSEIAFCRFSKSQGDVKLETYY